MDGSDRGNPFLAGNYAPVATEDDFPDLPVVGALPPELAGTLYRNGPNPQFPPRDANHHWFLGDGMVHAFHLEGGRARYRNRWVQTPKWQAEHAAGRALFGSWGNPATTDPAVAGVDSSVANTNIVWHAGRLLALEEAHRPFEIDPNSLAPRGYCDFAGRFAGRFTAHPKLDPVSGEMLFFSYAAGEVPLSRAMTYGVIAKDGTLTRLDRFEAPFCSMVHDFIVTNDHVLFPVLPLTGSLERAMEGGPAFAWEPAKGSHVGVLARSAPVSAIRWLAAPPCYVFHVLNAWDEGGRVLADVMQYERAPLFPDPDGRPGADSPARLVRWIVEPADGAEIRVEPLDDLAGEFPRVDDRRAGLPYRHGWYVARSGVGESLSFDSLAHLDLATGRRTLWRGGAGEVFSEPVFVPRAADAAEGDGWILATVYRGATDRSDLVVLAARDLAAGPVATVQLPRRVPFGFHGNWRPLAG